MLIYDWYFRQQVTEEQMNEAFAAAQTSMQLLMTDQSLVGIAVGGDVNQTTIPSLSVLVDLTTAYDQLGQRIATGGDTVDCSKDSNGTTTAVAGAGNEKYVSIFLTFNRTLTDPQIDGNGASVFYVQAEGYQYEIVQGAEAPVGTAAHPALIDPGLLLQDVHLIFGQTAIHNADLDDSREQFTFQISSNPFSMTAGTVQDAAGYLLSLINDVAPNRIVALASAATTANPFSTTSATMVDITGAAGTLSVNAGDKIFLSCSLIAGPTAGSEYAQARMVVVDGAATTQVGALMQTPFIAAAGNQLTVASSGLYTVVHSGTLTFKLQMLASSGTVEALQGGVINAQQMRPGA